MKTIAVPLDGSPVAEQALPYALELAKRHGATVELISAVELPAEFMSWAGAAASLAAEEIDGLVGARTSYLNERLAGLDGVSGRIRVVVGTPSAGISEAVATLDDPLLVMTSHGRSGAARLLIGSVASRVVRAVQCPVLLVRARPDSASARAAAAFNRVLVPLDGSSFGEEALDRGLAALGPGNVAVRLLRVIEIPTLRPAPLGDPSLPLDYGLIAEYVSASKDEAREYLEALSQRMRALGHDVSVEVREGQIADEINAAAAEHDADAIVMATHGRGGFSRLFLGSVAERVLHAAERPLLLVRPSGKH